MVLISTGKQTANAITLIRIASPKPRTIIAAGTIAMIGVARPSSTSGSNRRLAPVDEPISRPSAIPVPAPMTKPTASRPRLAATAPRKSLVGQTSAAVRSTELGAGIVNDPAERAHSSHAPKARTSTATPSSDRAARAITGRPSALRRPRRSPAARQRAAPR